MISQLLAGHYRILQVLGTGGFGQTYIAEDTHRPGNPKCVVKHLKPASSAPHVLEIARSLFQKEAETLERLGDHNQIPRLLAYFEENKEFYLVQEFIDGHPLSRELQPGKRWTENKILQMLIEVLSILEFVHSQQVIHRDIKPDNIIRRDGDGKLVLIDFGAIKQVRNQTVVAPKQVSLTVSIGTPGYMPTEQSRGKPRPNSDIYALGMIGIQASTGVYPSKLHELYEDPDTGEILWQSLASVSPSLAAILTKMTQYHFKDRYPTASEALEAVQQLAHPDTYTLQTTTIAITIQELTLEWVEAGIIKTRTIRSNQDGKNPGTIRIGRDPQACDLVLPEPTVSGLHVEIFFNTEQQRFYLRCLRQSNPPLVDGHLTTKEVELAPGSSLRLGDLDLRVAAISVKQYPTSSEYIECEYSTQPPSQPPQLVAKTLEPQPTSNFHSSVFPATPPNPSVVPSASSKLPLLIGLGVAGIVSVGGLAYMKLIPAQKELDTSQVKVTPSTSPASSPTVAAKKPDVASPVPSATPAKPDVASPVPSATPAKPVVTSPVPSITPAKPVVTSPVPSITPGIINHQNTPQQPKETVKKIEQRSPQLPSDHTSSDQSGSSSNPLPDSSKNSPENNQLDNEGMNILAEARILAMEGDLEAAIIQAQQVSQASSAYPDAQNEKALWQQQLASQNAQSQQQDEGENILAEARRLAADGNLAAAISKVEQVSQTSSAYSDAQTQKALWQKLLTKQNVESPPSNQVQTPLLNQKG
jgi:eukaryotic-like serine/threonine-protein kinase